MTTSVGCLSKLALVFEAVDYIRKKSRINYYSVCCGFWDPTLWIACIIRFCCFSFLQMMTKFCLIFHCFTGEDFWTSATRMADLLLKAGFKGLVLETAANNCFKFIGFVVSAALGIATWAWLGSEYGTGILSGYCGSSGDSCEALKWFMMIIFFGFIFYPTYALALVILIGVLVEAPDAMWIPWLCGLFIGAITSFFFDQTTNALLCKYSFINLLFFIWQTIDRLTSMNVIIPSQMLRTRCSCALPLIKRVVMSTKKAISLSRCEQSLQKLSSWTRTACP